MAVKKKRDETITEARARHARTMAEWRAKNREHYLAYRKQWSAAHREQEREYKRRTRAKNPKKWRAKDSARSRRWRARLGDEYKQRTADRNRRSKEEFIAAYGGKCSCCGEARFEFLTAEHIKGRAENQPQGVFVGPRMYRLLKKLGWPKDEYACLCMNCNFSRGRYGYCPHERERENAKPELQS